MGTRLSQITQSTFISFRPEDAATVVDILERADFSAEAIRTFLVEEGRPEDYPNIVSPLQDSVKRLKQWLGSVSPGKTGILSIG